MSLVLSARPMYGVGADPWELWQPTGVSGFALDIDPHFNVTIDNSLGSPHVAAITNRAPSTSDSFANANTSQQPAFESSGWLGTSYTRPSILFDGTAQYLACTSSLASTLVGGADTPFSLFLVVQNLTLAGTRAFLGCFSSSSNNPLWDLFTLSSLYQSLKRDDAATSQTPTGGTPDTNKHVLEVIQSGTALTVKVDGTAVINAVTQDVGTLTVNRMSLGATYGAAGPNNWANMRMARLLGFTGAVGTTDADYVRTSLTSMYL